MPEPPRWLRADNPGPFTLDGTRTYLVGRRDVAVIDPGPDLEAHVRSVRGAVAGARSVTLVLTHGHADHAGAVPKLASALAAGVVGPAGVAGVGRQLGNGDEVDTDDGPLVAVHTPGHTPEHLCYAWPQRRALFAGDLLLGEGDTTWVADYPGCVADYLASLARLKRLLLDVIYPAHGPELDEPAAAIERFEAHRRARIAQVREALAARPDATPDDLLQVVYGDTLPPGMEGPARKSLAALIEYVRG